MSSAIKQSLSREQHISCTRDAIQVLDKWGINADAKIMMLGYQDHFQSRGFVNLEQGMKEVPQSEDMIARVDHILGIAQALRTSYPSRPEAGFSWMKQKNGKLRGRTPIQCMLQDGRRGMVKIRSMLDCAWAWQQDDEYNPCWNKN